MTAAAWLISLSPILARFRAEDEALESLFTESHVLAWEQLPTCENCGERKPIVTRNPQHPRCEACVIEAEERHREENGRIGRDTYGPLDSVEP